MLWANAGMLEGIWGYSGAFRVALGGCKDAWRYLGLLWGIQSCSGRMLGCLEAFGLLWGIQGCSGRM